MTQHISYPTVGTCSRQIDIELEEGVIRSVTFTGGCSGNTQGVAALVRQLFVSVDKRLIVPSLTRESPT